MLYKDVCKQNVSFTIGILRAYQLGFLPEKTLNYAIDNNGDGLLIMEYLAKVKERLPKFVLKFPTY